MGASFPGSLHHLKIRLINWTDNLDNLLQSIIQPEFRRCLISRHMANIVRAQRAVPLLEINFSQAYKFNKLFINPFENWVRKKSRDLRGRRGQWRFQAFLIVL